MTLKQLTFRTQEETEAVARVLAHTLEVPQVIALSGDLGTGKTTFVRAFVGALTNGDKVRIKSPSYALHNAYGTTPAAHHLDLYRLNNIHQLEDLGLLEVIHAQDGFVLIEWPEIVDAHLPRNTIRILFEDIGDGARRVSVKTT